MNGMNQPFLGMDDLEFHLRKENYDISFSSYEELEIISSENGNVYWGYAVGNWVQIKCIYFTPDQYGDARRQSSLLQSIALLHYRLLGCRFALDCDNAIWIVQDVVVKNLTSTDFVGVIGQIQYIVDATLDDLSAVLEHGEPLRESDIDTMFGIDEDGDPGGILH